MKTKIIYISGSEIFNITDIRAAFEEVRCALALAPDTVLFGVPVDADDAALGGGDIAMETLPGGNAPVVAPEMPTDTPVMDDSPILSDSDNSQPTEDAAPVMPESIDAPTPDADSTPDVPTDIPPEVPSAEAPKPRRGRRPRAKSAAPDIAPAETAEAPAPTESNETPTVVPILSVLAAHTDAPSVADDSTPDDTPVATAPDDASPEITSVSISDIDISSGDPTDSDTTHISLADMITDDAPSDEAEKTLEQLLEKMTPLREDHSDSDDDDDAEDSDVPSRDAPEIEAAPLDLDDTDATLTQLATEFVESADKIPDPTPTQGRGKIGKLKNILPFKKAKREEPGIMGDLFGWAGIAANDDEFSIPGFFTTAAGKK